MRLPHGTAKKYTARWPDGYDYAVVIKNPHDPKYGLEDAEKPDEAKDEQVIPPLLTALAYPSYITTLCC